MTENVTFPQPGQLSLSQWTSVKLQRPGLFWALPYYESEQKLLEHIPLTTCLIKI